MSTGSRVLAIAAVALALAGCSTVEHSLPPAPRGTELANLTDRELELQWQYIGLTPDSPRPTVEVVRFITPDEAKQVYSDCMSEAGFPFYGSRGSTPGADNYERLAVYECTAKYPLPPATYGLFSRAQRAYIYDYYEQTLIPCIRSSGVDIGRFLSREEYTESESSSWNPLNQVHGVTADLSFIVQSRCAAYPNGFYPWAVGIDQ